MKITNCTTLREALEKVIKKPSWEFQHEAKGDIMEILDNINTDCDVQAQAAAMRWALEQIVQRNAHTPTTVMAEKALSQDAGRELLERMRKAEAAARAWVEKEGKA